MLFTDLMSAWLEIVKSQVRPNTYRSYCLLVNNSIIPFFEPLEIELAALQPVHIQSYYQYRINQGIGAQTIRRAHSNIHKALNYALKNNWIIYNPSDRVELPKAEQYIGNFYTAEQLIRIIDLFRGTILFTPVMLASVYGLRRSEVLGLKWSAIDFEQKRIMVHHTIVGSGANIVYSNLTKTNSSRRSLFLLPEVESYLCQLKSLQGRMKIIHGEAYNEEGYVCVNESGRVIYPEYLTRYFPSTVMKDGSLPVYRFHDLRHSSASLLLNEGYSLKEIGSWLGHSSIHATNRYAHLQTNYTEEMAVSVAGSLFTNAGKRTEKATE